MTNAQLQQSILIVSLILGGLLLLLWSWFYFKWPRPVVRHIRGLWRRGQHEEAATLAKSMLPRLENLRLYRDLATVRLWIAARAWENHEPRKLADQSRRAVDEALVAGKPWQQLLSEIAYGWALVAMGRPEEARKPLEAAELRTTTLNLQEPRMFIRTALGQAHLAIGNRQLAVDYARAACSDVSRYPTSAFTHPRLCFELGKLCHELGLWDEALLRLDEAQAHSIEGSLVNAEALLLHARIDLERGAFDRAVQVLERNLQRLPPSASVLRGWHHLYLARIHALAQQPQAARLALEQARMDASQVTDPELACQIGLALTRQLRQQQQHAAARDLLLRLQVELLSEEPGSQLAQTLLAWGEWFLEQGDDREAYAHFRLGERLLSGLDQPTLDPDLPYRLALLHHRMGLLTEGVRYEQEGDALRRRLGIQRPPPMRPTAAARR